MSIVNIQVAKDKKGNIIAPMSEYKPDKESINAIAMVRRDAILGHEIMHKPYREFDNMSLLQRMAEDQKAFNSYREPRSNNPDEAWHSNAVRPITRNKVISIAAHVTGAIMFPNIFAQNENDKEDKDSAAVMRNLMEWVNEQAEYDKTFVYSVISALVNPATIIHTEYCESWRKIKEIMEDGSWKTKEIMDEIFSGFKDMVVPLDELYINDVYEADIQKQGFLIRRRAVDYTVAESKYNKTANWKYVKPGMQVVYLEDQETFYEQFDENLRGRLVEELIYYNRREDLQIVLLNGVLITKPDEPNPRKDKMYPFAKSGYEPIDEGRFFYYKSLVNKMGPDQDVIDVLYRMIIDGTFLQLMPPTAIFGDEAVNSSVIAPGTVTTFRSEKSKLQKIDVGSDLTAGYNTLEKVEASVKESSTDLLQSGQAEPGIQTATEITRLEQNARTMLGLFGKMIGFMVRDLGKLKISDILQYLTIGDVQEIEGDVGRLRFRSFLLPEKTAFGRTVTSKVEFTQEVPEEPIPEEEAKQNEFKLLEEEGGMDAKLQIYKVNPKLFRRMKFLVKVAPDMAVPESDNIKRALNLEVYDRAISHPLANQEALYRDLLLGSYSSTKDDPDKYITEKNPNLEQLVAGEQAQAPMA